MSNIIQTFYISLVLCFFLAPVNSSGSAQESCEIRNQKKFYALSDELYNEYLKVKPQSKIIEEQKAFWIRGNPNVSKALFLAHGYMGSPREMIFLAEPFLKKGWSVIGFLIPGHGSDYEIANSYSMERISKEFQKQIDLLFPCFTEVRAVGFSTGGLLIHNYLLTTKAPSNLKGVHYISPLFRKKFGSFFDRVIAFFFDGISVEMAYRQSGLRDLLVMLLDPKSYNQRIPMHSGVDIVKFGEWVSLQQKPQKNKVPAQLFVTDGDLSIDIEESKEIILNHYESVDLVWYRDDSPHHLMAPTVSHHAKDVQKRIFDFAHMWQ